MELSTLDTDVEFISKLDDQPNDVGGLSPAELKAKFDAGSAAIKEFINATHIPELQSLADAMDGAITLLDGITGIQTDTISGSDAELVTGKAVASYVSAMGGGDMTTATYDPDKDGKVVSAQTADQAAKLSTARTIAATGAASGSASFDGSQDVSLKLSALNPAYLSSPVPLSRGGTGGTTSASAMGNLMRNLPEQEPTSAYRIPMANVSGSTASYATIAALGKTMRDSGLTGQWELLWTNRSPTKAFSAQTISFDNLSAYTLFLCVYYPSVQDPGQMTQLCCVPDGMSAYCTLTAVQAANAAVTLASRAIVCSPANNYIQIDNAQSVSGGSTAADNTGLIPVYILASKLST